MNMKAKEPAFHSVITMHMRCFVRSIMQEMYSLIVRENGIRLLTAVWRRTFHGIILLRNMQSYITGYRMYAFG